MASLDFSSDLGRRIDEQLRDEYVLWMTTSSSDGTPQPRLVWFVREGDSILIYSQPGTAKLAHIARNPRVALSFNSDRTGEHMSVLIGSATIDGSAPRAIDHPAYIEKYRSGIEALGSTPEQFSEAYAVPVRVQIEKMRGF